MNRTSKGYKKTWKIYKQMIKKLSLELRVLEKNEIIKR